MIKTAKNKPQHLKKKEAVDKVADKIKNNEILVLTDYRGEGAGLTVKLVNDLRRRLNKDNAELKVFKNTLTKMALKKLKIEGLDDQLEGPIALVFGEDGATTAKILAEFAKENKIGKEGLPVLKAGYYDGELLDSAKLKQLASLPTKEVLYARLIGSIQSPLYGVVNVLQGTVRSIVYALSDLRKKKEAEGTA
ncbi:MAG: 50S ribosomal protein L10 [Armatimonadota bacterium]